MEITPAAVVGMQVSNVQTDVAVNVLKRVLDVQAQQGAQLAQMIAQASGVGQNLDVMA